jgi:hypothetical protein
MELFSATPNGTTTELLFKSTIDVNSYPLIDWTFYSIVLFSLIFLTIFTYALHQIADEAGARRQQDQSRVEWSRLSRSIRNARRDFGGVA